ncbi:uncharacterized protein LOC121242950 [Juglans microcarpa x Juglans regia]|uniref:uncharacterized protein LOC121242950 n=1 Tax=Juglans microcarpa x Juglans regia TaxID=2249226 RepID=UPI001B7DF60D|nr:uncharacterized protein LOC121242950 [Juglans microcarpa x Juglans regia]
MLVEARFYLYGGSDHVYLNYSFPECIEQLLLYPTGDNMRFRFYCDSDKVMFKSCGVHIIYKHEENKNLTVGECSVDSSNGIQLSKRRRDDGNSNVELNGYPQHKRHSQNLGNSNGTQLGLPQSYSCQPSHAQITPSSSFDWSEFLMSEPLPWPGFQ